MSDTDDMANVKAYAEQINSELSTLNKYASFQGDTDQMNGLLYDLVTAIKADDSTWTPSFSVSSPYYS